MNPFGVAKCNFGVTKNRLNKSDLQVFVKFTKELKGSLQWIYFYCILGAMPCFMLSVVY